MDDLTREGGFLVKDLRDTVQNVNGTFTRLNEQALSQVNMDNLKSSIDRLNQTTLNLAESTKKIDEVIDKAGATMDSTKKAADDIQLVLADARKTIQSAGDVIREARTGSGMLATLVNNQEVAKDLQALISNMRDHGVLFYRDSARKAEERAAQERATATGTASERTLMTPVLTLNLLRVLFVTFCGTIGGLAGAELQDNSLPGIFIGIVFGLLVVLADRLLKGVSLRAFSSATFGLLLGLFFANLLIASEILRYQSETVQWTVRLIVYCTFGYLGMMLAMRSNRDEFSLIIPYVRFARETTQHEPLVIDTNIIIDGRIADLCATGFLSRSLIVPRFVLDELQTLADSRDPIKRERGRRGLEILNQLQRAREIELTIHDTTGDTDLEDDARLVRIAKLLRARLLTNDNALCQVARLQQVPALNLADLSRALRPIVVAGDELELSLVKEGRDAHQAVGYLADGTMIVVNHARAHIGKSATVVVSSALQTAAGRLIFAELKNATVARRAAIGRCGGQLEQPASYGTRGVLICDEFYNKSPDPWGFRTSWYEQRKREIVIAFAAAAKFQQLLGTWLLSRRVDGCARATLRPTIRDGWKRCRCGGGAAARSRILSRHRRATDPSGRLAGRAVRSHCFQRTRLQL